MEGVREEAGREERVREVDKGRECREKVQKDKNIEKILKRTL